jgi:hypothetical protein
VKFVTGLVQVYYVDFIGVFILKYFKELTYAVTSNFELLILELLPFGGFSCILILPT